MDNVLYTSSSLKTPGSIKRFSLIEGSPKVHPPKGMNPKSGREFFVNKRV